MHDPSTLAFDIRIGGFRLAEIWHIDPETNGDDDSCGWASPPLTDREKALADALLTHPYDNLCGWFGDDTPSDEAIFRVSRIFQIHKAHIRHWYQHPRWHIHHWRIKVVPVFKLKRWLFTRCAYCGKRLPWGYDPTRTTWNGTGPLWFRSEGYAYHHECYSEAHHASV